jgi:hypothetical protein
MTYLLETPLFQSFELFGLFWWFWLKFFVGGLVDLTS